MSNDAARSQPRSAHRVASSALLTGANVFAGTAAFFWAARPPSGATEDRLPADIFMRFSLAAAAIILIDGLLLASRPSTRSAGFGVLLGGIATLAITVGVVSMWAIHAYGDG